ncbi:hypothetical protein LguiA_001223 [Lonicera macranthoides]
MATTTRRNSDDRRPPSRLQRRAPSSIQINPVTDWNVAIPLLSPLITSPSSPNRTAEAKSSNKEESRREHLQAPAPAPEKEKPVVYKKWQHPAAPFCYESVTFVPFVCTGAVDSS